MGSDCILIIAYLFTLLMTDHSKAVVLVLVFLCFFFFFFFCFCFLFFVLLHLALSSFVLPRWTPCNPFMLSVPFSAIGNKFRPRSAATERDI